MLQKEEKLFRQIRSVIKYIYNRKYLIQLRGPI